MRILVCGGRDFGIKIPDYQFIQKCLEMICDAMSEHYTQGRLWFPTDITIIHGCANGADSAASDYAISNDCQEERYPADWDKYGKSAGYRRNAQMLSEGKPDFVVAFPGGKGTAMMVDLARKAGVEVIEMGAKGSQTMTTGYSIQDLRTLKAMAILKGDKAAEKAVGEVAAREYEEIMQAQDVIEKMDPKIK